ncbi:Alkaline protease 1 [Fusarium oxysporum f. sp. rapae]|uniref:Alkaline protease 1 n=1 Tax=Fusarium oxysporum f. sp. rapae TaxID=485398 RepID=A0A8J5P5Y5_FUSOX|nr:Alkaline protease 1 [Fusarium oxysporum f. sp. rapae]
MTGKRGIPALPLRWLRVSRKILGPQRRPATSEAIAHRSEVTCRSKLQLNAPWNLARISQGHARNDGLRRYRYDATAGSGTYVYVVGSGINFSHAEFSGRAFRGANFVLGSPDDDESDHGTHIAGITGGKTYGVAKNCTMISVKVVSKSGRSNMLWIRQGINWVADDAIAKGIADRSDINVSAGGLYNASVNVAVKNATDARITVVVAVGNHGTFASAFSPASADTAITVAASGPDDCRAPFSNYGPCVDMFAPGAHIASDWNYVDNGIKYESGMSAVAAHVTGLAAYFISSENLRGFKAVRERILGASLNGVITDTRYRSNRLAYNDNRVS